MKQETLLRTAHNLSHHAPKNEEITRKIESLRTASKIFLSELSINCPESRELSLALTHLEQTLMWAVAQLQGIKMLEICYFIFSISILAILIVIILKEIF